MKMKKAVAVAVAIALLVSLTACGGFNIKGTWQQASANGETKVIVFGNGQCPNLDGLGPGATYGVSNKGSNSLALSATSTFGDYTRTYYVKIVDKNHMDFYTSSNMSNDSYDSSFTRMK